MFPILTRTDLDELRTVTLDATVPPMFRADLTDMLDRRDELTRCLRQTRVDLDSAQRATRTVRDEVSNRLITAATAPLNKQTERSAAADLDKAHRSVLDLDRYREVLDRAVHRLDNRIRYKVVPDHLADLVRWVAAQRLDLDWWTAPTGTVSTVWRYTAPHVALELPLDAWETAPGVFTPESLRLVVDLREVRTELAGRVMFAWAALHAGHYERTESGAFKITASWSTRPVEPARPAPKARRRVFGFSTL